MRTQLRILYHRIQKVIWIILLPLIRAVVKLNSGNLALTCDRTDGGGAQLHGRISTLVFARAVGLPFVNTPMSVVDYATPMDVNNWNRVIDFEKISDLSTNQINSTINVLTHRELVLQIFWQSLAMKKLEGVRALKVAHCHYFTDRFPILIEQIRDELRDNLGSTLTQTSRPNCTEAVLHVRGAIGGVSDDSPRRSSFMAIQGKIEQARSRGMKITIYCSEYDKRLEDFGAKMEEIDAKSDVFQVLRCVINASQFYMAKSSLSYVGAILTKGEVIYEEFWHPKLSNWTTFQVD